MATKLPWAEITEDWRMSCTMTGHPVWGKILFFLVGFSILCDGISKACLSQSVWTCGCGTAWVLGAIGGWGDAVSVSQLSNFWAKLPDTLSGWVVRGGSEVRKHLLVYCTEMIHLLPKPIRSILGSLWLTQVIHFSCQWPRCGELIVQQILCCLGEISWGFADGQWL